MIATPRIMLNVFVLMPLIDQAVTQHAEHERAEEGADDGAGPAGEGGATDDGGGDAVEHQLRAAGQGVERGDADPLADPAEPGERGREHEVADLDPLRLHAGLASADRVAAGGDRVHAPPRVRQHDVEDAP